MICSKCKSELKPDAVVCLKCGQPVSSKPLGFPCVICGAPIPPGVEECTQCGGSVAKAPANTGRLSEEPVSETPPVELDGSVELEPFQLDDIVIAAPPPPPPPRRTQAAVDQFEPLPDLVPRDATEQPAFPALGIELMPKPQAATEPVPPIPPAPVAAPAPVTPVPAVSGVRAPAQRVAATSNSPAVAAPVQPAVGPQAAVPVVNTVEEPEAAPALPPQLTPLPGVKPVRPAGQRPVVPGYVAPAAVAAPVPAVPRAAAPGQPVATPRPQVTPVLPAEGPIPPAPPIPELQAVMRPRVATLPPVDTGNLGPQPEDVVDADAARRRKLVLTVAGSLFGVIVVLIAAGYLILAKPWQRAKAEPETLQERVDRQFADNRLQAPAPLPGASPAAAVAEAPAASAPEAAASVAPAAVSAPVSAPAVATPPAPQVAEQPPEAAPKPVAKREPAAKPAAKSSRRTSTQEEDAYLRQIHRQLRN